MKELEDLRTLGTLQGWDVQLGMVQLSGCSNETLGLDVDPKTPSLRERERGTKTTRASPSKKK